MRGFKIFLVGLTILVLDHFTKFFVHVSLFNEGLPVFSAAGVDFCIQHVTNRGIAWGIGGSFQDIILWIRIVVVAGLIGYLIFSPKARPYQYPLTMIAAGGLSNILDTFRYGHVIDMFHFTFWGYSFPVFNVADSFIFLGVVWMMGRSLQRKKNDIPQTQ